MKNLLAVDASGILYVNADIIPRLIWITDGLPLTRFGNERTTYIAMAEAIAWVAQECRSNPAYANREIGKSGSTGRQLLASLEHILEQHQAGASTVICGPKR